MSIDVIDLSAFYKSSLGLIAHRYTERAINRFMPHVHGQRILGLGHATPYLEKYREEAASVLAFMPATQGVVNWPSGAHSSSALIDPLTMPLADGSIDRVILIHALEMVQSPSELLQEIWRILTPGGRLVMITPNRRGLWARMDTTPFGHGQPFSRTQLKALMREALFSPESWAEILYVPPLDNRILLQTASAWERFGSSFSLPFSVAGLHVVDATKQLYRPAISGNAQKSRRLRQVLMPATHSPVGFRRLRGNGLNKPVARHSGRVNTISLI